LKNLKNIPDDLSALDDKENFKTSLSSEEL